MRKLLDLYLSNFVTRYDKDGIIPYLSNADFDGLHKEELSFVNSLNNKVSYFFYYYDNYRTDKIIMFLHGIGPGHTAYMSEINEICKKGYKVLTLDYTGCDKSEGKTTLSINQPTKDVFELLNYLDLKEEINVIGHSWGGYTALNTININSKINKAVIISGFISLKKELKALMKLTLLILPALKFESKLCDGFNNIDNVLYLKNTSDKLLFIHSLDDKLVPFNSATGFVQKKIKNDNLKFIIANNKGHNPNYSLEALKYMNNTFSTYHSKIKSGELDTLEKKKEYMMDKSARKMTIQDDLIWKDIFEFID